jgi:hypothetical protein
MTRDLPPYASLLLGIIVIGGFRYWLAQLRYHAQRLTTPRVVYVTEPEPVVERTLCIACGKLVRRDLMSWDGYDFLCDECMTKDRI